MTTCLFATSAARPFNIERSTAELERCKPASRRRASLPRAKSFPFPRTPPYPDDPLRMMDEIVSFVPDGGPKGIGFIEGRKKVRPDEWFFKAHFHQDPVWPGSLGLE